MSLSHQTLTLYASATVQINPIAGTIPDYCEGMTLSVQNLHASNYVYLGNSGTSSVSYGFRLAPGQAWSADLDPSDIILATTNNTSSQIAITRLFWQ
jgi:hypothetical protein